MAAQIFYPDEFNGAFAACPDPIDFRALHGGQHLRGHERVLHGRPVGQGAAAGAPQLPRPRGHDARGDEPARAGRSGRRDARAASGTSGRRSTRPSAPTATRSRSGTSAPASSTSRSPSTGASTTTCRHILQRDWETGLGAKLAGKLHIYVGDMDNYYLNNAVYLVEDFLKTTKNPPYDGRGRLRRPRRALLERRPHARQRVLAPALPPDVRAEDRRADPEDGAGRRGRDELEVLGASLSGLSASG